MFREDAYPARAIAEYLSATLARGGAAIVLAAGRHLDELSLELGQSDLRVAELIESGHLTLVDAHRLAEAIIEGGSPRATLFESSIGYLVRGKVGRHPSVRIYDEVVNVLMLRGHRESARRLEIWWNELMSILEMELCCGYDMAGFADARSVETFRRVCEHHAHVTALPRPELSVPDDGRILAQLQQALDALSAETDRCREVETAAGRDRTESQAHVQNTRARLQLLLETSARITGAQFSLRGIADALVTGVARPGFAHGCVMKLQTTEDGTPPLYAMHHLDPELGARLARQLERSPVAWGEGLVDRVVSTGRALHVNTREALIPATAADRETLELHSISSALVVALRGSAGVIGTLMALRIDSDSDFDNEDQQLLQDLADRAALSIENALLYERTQEERRRAESASRAKDEFLAMLGHELRNPLAPIVTALELIRVKSGPEESREHAIIRRQVKRLTHLVDDLLDVSRLARGKISLERAPLEISEIIQDAIEMASPLFEQRHHHLSIDVPAQGLRVDGDKVRLTQVFANLLTNAAKYTEKGGHIAVRGTSSQGRVEVSVRDDGIGIAPDLMPSLFELFVQGRRASDRPEGGLGLGLALVRSLVERHDGEVTARSEGPGRGSEFVVRLPALEVSPKRPNPVPLPAVSPRAISGRRVLIVDDNQDAAEILAEALRARGHTLHVLYDPLQALEEFARIAPEVAILDIGLPVMDGYELALKLREAGCRARLLALTGYGQPRDRVRALEAGFDAHFVKPVDLGRLSQVIAGGDAGTGDLSGQR